MSSNIADLIENYILQQLAAQNDGKVELRRNDIAGEIACAPSQISYVLNTRFTHDKGFVVESRRGLGGYIRIVQVQDAQSVLQKMAESIDSNITYTDIKNMINYLIQHDVISKREAALLARVTTAMFESTTMAVEEKIRLLRSLFLTLDKFDS